MHSSVGAIRGTRANPRFVRPASRHRERRLGLHPAGLTRTPPAPRSAARAPGGSLVRRLHEGRGTVIAPTVAGGSVRLRRSAGFSWSPGATALARRPRPYHAAPWRS